MPLNAQGYFNALRSYLNTNKYEVKDIDNGRIVLKEKVFVSDGTKPIEYKVRLSVTGETLVIRLDLKNPKGKNDPLFHFLDDNAKPWSKRCDFVIFHRIRNQINVYCIEFKSATLPESIVDQLEASESWCRALHSTIKHYTGETKRMYLKKFVFSSCQNPAPYLDRTGLYLQRDHSVRHYLYQEVDGHSIEELENTNVESIN